MTNDPFVSLLTVDDALKSGAAAAVVSDHWARGGEGAVDIARKLTEVCENVRSDFKFAYDRRMRFARDFVLLAILWTSRSRTRFLLSV